MVSHRWAITSGERRAVVQALCRCPAWGPASAAIADVLGRRIHEKSPSLAVIQLPVTWLVFCWWQRLHAYCKYPYSTKTVVNLLGYTHISMGSHSTWSFPTSPHSWLVFLTCLPPHLTTKRSQLEKIAQKTGRLSVVRQVWTKPVPLRNFVSFRFWGWGLAGCAMQCCGKGAEMGIGSNRWLE